MPSSSEELGDSEDSFQDIEPLGEDPSLLFQGGDKIMYLSWGQETIKQMRQNRKERKKYASRISLFVLVWMAFVGVAIWLQGSGPFRSVGRSYRGLSHYHYSERTGVALFRGEVLVPDPAQVAVGFRTSKPRATTPQLHLRIQILSKSTQWIELADVTVAP